MKRHFKKSAGWVALGAAFALVAGAPLAHAQAGGATAGLFDDEVVARGDGFEIRESQLDEAYIQYKATTAARGESIDSAQREVLRKKILERLASEQILLKMASPEDQKKGNELADGYIGKAKEQAGSQAAYERQLLTLGMDSTRFETRIREKMIMDAVLERKLRSQIVISDEKAMKYYNENPERFEQKESVTVQHILIGTFNPRTRQPLSEQEKREKLAIANKLHTQALSGEDFTKLAETYSDDRGASGKGGEYTFAKGMMAPEFEQAAFAMTPDQISGVVETQYGYHIIKMLSRDPARKLPFEEVKEQLKAGLERKEFEEQLDTYLAKLRSESHVQFLIGE